MHLFDGGYNNLRETIFENQKRLGVIPKDQKLTPWPNDVLKPWDQLTAEEKKLFIRQVEVFAAYVAYNDHEIGRVIQAFEDLGKLDNTLIIYISPEGGPLGTPNEVAFFNGVTVPVDAQMKFYDVWGTALTYNHMSAGWSWAFDTPFDWFKQNASRLGSKDPEKCHSNILMGRLHNIFEQDHGSVSGTAPLASFECVFNGAQNDTR